MAFIFVAVPAKFRPGHNTFGSIPRLEVETKVDKDGKVIFPIAAWSAFVKEHPGCAYTITDVDDPEIRLGGETKLLGYAAKAAAAGRYQITERYRVAAVTESQERDRQRMRADLEKAQLRHKMGCPYRLLEKHERNVCTCGMEKVLLEELV